MVESFERLLFRSSLFILGFPLRQHEWHLDHPLEECRGQSDQSLVQVGQPLRSYFKDQSWNRFFASHHISAKTQSKTTLVHNYRYPSGHRSQVV